tara:strand:+ start:653 stop:2686 length:2034 start_codon:yes stop_codon:yes gene_type:complete
MNEKKIQNISINILKKPKLKDIDGFSRSKKNQKWKRNPIPDNWETLSAKKQDKFIDLEFERRENGYWFMNNGVATYITGAHYYYMNWCQIDIGYPDYWDRDRRFFLVWNAVRENPDAFGLIMPKHRRQGASWKAAAIVLHDVSSSFNASGGMLSKTGSDAKKLFDKVVYIFRKLPSFFQPIIEGTDSPKTVLSFKKPGERITKNNTKVKTSEALESQIDWRNTKNNSYDGEKLKTFISDEGGKWLEADVSKNWQIVKPALSQGRKIIGKAFLPSTVNEMNEGGAAFKDIWDDSDQEDIVLGTKRTRSGLFRYFTPAYDGFEGFIDEFGMSVIDNPKKGTKDKYGDLIDIGSKEYLTKIREGFKNDTNKLAEHKRQFPWTPEEAFRVNTDTCLFDSERIYQQIDYIEGTGGAMVTKGDFRWENGVRDSRVIWTPSAKGKWSVVALPEKEKRNAKRKTYLGWSPCNELEFVSGCDPFDHDVTTDGRRSDAAAYMFRKLDVHDQDNSHMFVAQYIHRPPKAELFFEDMLMMSVFYGAPMLVENNKIGLIQYFKRRGYEGFLMARPESTHTKFSRKQTEVGIPATGSAVANSIVDSIQAYVYDYVGINEETGSVGRVFFYELLKDWLEFDVNNRTKFDASMASGFTLLASQKHVKPKIEIKRTAPFVHRYSNNGSISKRIR